VGRKVLPNYTVIRDTREKENHGWIFRANDHPKRRPPFCLGMVDQCLKTGDYSMVGYEDIFAIERKRNMSELWGNYDSATKRKENFEEELGRMKDMPFAYLLIETSMTSDHLSLTPPQYRTGVPGKRIFHWLHHHCAKNGVHMMFVGDAGQKTCDIIMQEVCRINKDRWAEQ